MAIAETRNRPSDPALPDPAPAALDRQALLDDLRRRIAAIERRPARFDSRFGDRQKGAHPAVDPWRFGLGDLDESLRKIAAGPAGLHEIAPAAPGDAAAAAGFALALALRLSRAAETRQALLWCQLARDRRERGRLYGPGLTALGLDPAALLMVRARRGRDLFWALEEALRAETLAAVIGEAAPHDPAALRRLSLAAADSGTPLLLLPVQGADRGGALLTRWQVTAAPSATPRDTDVSRDAAPGFSRWRLALTRCRGGRPGAWTLEWDHETGCFALAASLAD